MRCPKCGFISFDSLETCKKCHKFIGDVGTGLNGTVYEATSPRFLQAMTVASPQARPAAVASAALQPTEELVVDQQEFELSNDEVGDLDFALDQVDTAEPIEPEPQTIDKDELIMDLEAFTEVPPNEEFTLNLDETAEGGDSPLPTLDFGDLDISDLAPPDMDKTPAIEQSLMEVEIDPRLTLASEPVAAPATPPPPPPATEKGAGLEDLNFNGLDLDTPSKLVTGSAAGKRYLPSVKTGTALDKFDIDLGELFTEKKNN